MKLPISLEDLQAILETYKGEIVNENPNSYIIQIKNTLIEVWYTTGTFMNCRTKFKSKGRKSLIDYLEYLEKQSKKSSEENNSKSLTEEKDLLKLITELSRRVDNLEAEIDNLKTTYAPLNAYV